MKYLLAIFIVMIINGCAHSPKEPPRKLNLADYSNERKLENSGLTIIDHGQLYFPTTALRENQQGWCVAEFDVSENGTTENINIVDCSPGGMFEYVCKTMVSQFKYAKKGLPASKVIHVCQFRLKN